MLSHAKLVAFVAASDASRARAFYRDTLGLRLVSDDAFALVFDAHGTQLRVTLAKEVTPVGYTVLGWEVADVAATIDALRKKGVEFRRYSGLVQDERGVWTAPGGARVAWFGDPDGNVLSLTQPPR